jgi:hypothetical protein
MRSFSDAIHMAIEALQNSRPLATEDDCVDMVKKHNEALSALRDLLARQEPVAEVHRSHLRPGEDGRHWCREVLLYSGNSPHDYIRGENYRVKLYAAPPVHEWVGLSDDERNAIYDAYPPYSALIVVEDLLKEKNCGEPPAKDHDNS